MSTQIASAASVAVALNMIDIVLGNEKKIDLNIDISVITYALQDLWNR